MLSMKSAICGHEVKHTRRNVMSANSLTHCQLTLQKASQIYVQDLNLIIVSACFQGSLDSIALITLQV